MAIKTRETTDLQRAGLAIKTLRARVRELEQAGREPVAVVGAACRFPGGIDSADALWSALLRGQDSVGDIPEGRWNKEALYDERPGAPGKLYTFEAGWLDDIDLFDAAFFNISPKEALNIDPQHRLLLETCWHAFEEAGEKVDRQRGAQVGVFVGATAMDYAFHTVQAGRSELLNGSFTTGVTLNGGAGRVAYTFGFTGPCLAVDTACSSSLSALHLAIRSLRGRECDQAVAAGVNVNLFPGNTVCMCEAGLISPSGRCRSFDASADGMVRGEGCGAVVLKRLSDAVAEGNHIHAVIRGSAMNQDGASSSLSAPNGRAQEALLRAALADAGVDADAVDYVEAHGSATRLGDPIEVRALSAVYGVARSTEDPLWIGSVKTNLGHLESASGMAGLLKTVWSLKNEAMVRQLHFAQPSTDVDWERSNVRVCATDRAWPRSERPRRGAVSGFGVSGTNVHVVLEEAPRGESAEEQPPHRSHVALVLSAPTPSGLESVTQRLVTHLAEHPEHSLRDVAFTLQTGRAEFAHRRALVCDQREGAIEALASLDPARVVTRQVGRGRSRPVVFMFPGTGEHYRGMGAELYRSESVYRRELDRCAALIEARTGVDLIDLLYGASSPSDRPSAPDSSFEALVRGEPVDLGDLGRTLYAHPAVFSVEYALGRQLMAWGLQPQLMIGYSTGEYVAAALAGIMSPQGALAAVLARAELIEATPQGAMLSVLLGPRALEPYMPSGVWLAAVNAPELCVVAGRPDAIEALAERLAQDAVACRRVAVQHAFHTPMLASIERDFRSALSELELRAPEIPIVSNVTGKRMTAGEAQDPGYWYRHAISPVRFADGMVEICKRPERVLLEVGPGQGLCSFALQADTEAGRLVCTTLPTRYEGVSAVMSMQATLAKLWLHGVTVDWRGLYARGQCQRLSLPTYPFERGRHWIDTPGGVGLSFAGVAPPDDEKAPLERWYTVPEWRRCNLSYGARRVRLDESEGGAIVILGDRDGLAAGLERMAREDGAKVVRVTAGSAFHAADDSHFEIDPQQSPHYELLCHHLRTSGTQVRSVVHLWGAEPLAGPLSLERARSEMQRGFYSILSLLQALGETALEEGVALVIVTGAAQDVLGGELEVPERALVHGLSRVAPQEIKGLSCSTIDLAGDPPPDARWAAMILEELGTGLPEAMVAYRGSARWVRELAEVSLPATSVDALDLPRGGVYLITGGLGGLGRAIVGFLAEHFAPHLVLIGRSAPPPPDRWDDLIARGPDACEEDRGEYEQALLLSSLAARDIPTMTVQADAADRDQLAAALEKARRRMGPIDAIFHCAGVPGAGLIMTKTAEACEAVFAPKVAAAMNLAELCRRDPVGPIVYASSMMALHGAVGQSDYSAANAFLDALAHYQRASGLKAASINWGMWQTDTWQDRLTQMLPEVQRYLRERRERLGIRIEEGMDALGRVLCLGAPQVGVSPVPTKQLLREHQEFDIHGLQEKLGHSQHERPAGLLNQYVAARSDTERTLADIWSAALGVDPVGVHDDFFELGGHSLLASRIVAEVGRRFGIGTSIRALFAAKTVERYATVIEEQLVEEIAALPDPDLESEADEVADGKARVALTRTEIEEPRR